jgi:hypothetical protein
MLRGEATTLDDEKLSFIRREIRGVLQGVEVSEQVREELGVVVLELVQEAVRAMECHYKAERLELLEDFVVEMDNGRRALGALRERCAEHARLLLRAQARVMRWKVLQLLRRWQGESRPSVRDGWMRWRAAQGGWGGRGLSV